MDTQIIKRKESNISLKKARKLKEMSKRRKEQRRAKKKKNKPNNHETSKMALNTHLTNITFNVMY